MRNAPEDAEAMLALLESEFSLQVPEVTALWPDIVKRHEAFLASASGQ